MVQCHASEKGQLCVCVCGWVCVGVGVCVCVCVWCWCWGGWVGVCVIAIGNPRLRCRPMAQSRATPRFSYCHWLVDTGVCRHSACLAP